MSVKNLLVSQFSFGHFQALAHMNIREYSFVGSVFTFSFVFFLYFFSSCFHPLLFYPASSGARLAQSVERQALNLMVVGSSPTVGACL